MSVPQVKIYRAVKNEIRDQGGRQIAVVLASGCSKKDANMMASYAAQQMNHEAQRKHREALQKAYGKRASPIPENPEPIEQVPYHRV